jgi:CRP-like cAMP-binding protein
MSTQYYPLDAAAYLATIPLLEGLSAEDIQQIAPQVETRTYRQNEMLFRRGDPGGALIVVVRGKVTLFVYNEQKEIVILSTVGVGGFFGEVTLFNGEPRTTYARAAEPTRILSLRREVMEKFLATHPAASIHMIDVLSNRLRQTTQLISQKPLDPVEQLTRQMTRLERIADRFVSLIGSWRYVLGLAIFVLLWVELNTAGIFGEKGVLGFHDEPPEFFLLVTLLTLISAFGTPLILISQRRQDRLEKIKLEQERQSTLQTELMILELRGKIDWVQETLMGQTERIDNIERVSSAHLPLNTVLQTHPQKESPKHVDPSHTPQPDSH